MEPRPRSGKERLQSRQTIISALDLLKISTKANDPMQEIRQALDEEVSLFSYSYHTTIICNETNS
jgi:hypothetical protein